MKPPSRELEAVRVCPRAFVRAECLDCGDVFVGQIGIRFLETPKGQGVEVTVCVNGQSHSIARVPRSVVPTVKVTE